MRKITGLFMMLIIAGFLSCSGSKPPVQGEKGQTAQETSLLSKLPVDTAITIGRLENGITYYIRKNHKPENRAELRLVVNAGSILEDDDQQGLAHFTEHMAFNGTRHFAKQHLVDYLESIGMRFGPDLNAYTSFDETVYMLQIPTDNPAIIDTAFQILTDWAAYLSFDDDEIDKERGVVIEEWRLGRGAQARIRDKQFPILFHGSRYAERLPIGKKAVLDTFHHETLRRFYRTWYKPDLMAVIAVGDFDKAQIQTVIKQKFSQVPAPEHPTERPFYPVPGHQQTLYAIATDKEATGSSVSLFIKHDVHDEDSEAAYRHSLVQALYHGMLNQRLDELLQKPDPPFLNAYSGQGRFVRTKEFYILGAAVKANQIESGLEAVLTEARRVKEFGFTESELKRQKAELLRSMESAYKERDKTNSRAYASEYIRNFLNREPIPGIEFEYQLYKKHIPSITLDEVNRVSKELLTDSNRVVLVSAPEKEDVKVPTPQELVAVFDRVSHKEIEPYAEAVTSEPLIAQQPSPGKILFERKDPKIGITEWQLSNGIRVILKPTDFKNDEIIFRAYSPGGNSLVPDSDYVAALTADDLVDASGVGKFDLITLQKLLAGKEVNVSPWIGSLQEGLSGGASPQDAETMFQLIYLYVTAPRMDSSAYLSYKSRLKGVLENRAARPENAFSDTVKVIMAQHHFRARPWTVETLKEMDMERSFAIYRDRFRDAGDFTFLFVGNIDMKQFRSWVETYLASLPTEHRKESWRDVGIRPPRGVINKAVFRGVEPKSRVRIIFSGPFDWTRKNRYAIRSLASVLNIKLREKLREDEGGTYGVGVWASPSEFPVPQYRFNISFGCAPENVEKLVKLVFLEIDSVKQFGVAEEYIQKVQETQRRSYETDLKRNGYWLSALEFYYSHGEPPTNILDFPEFVDQLSREGIQEASEQYLNESNYVEVILFPENFKKEGSE